MISMTELDEARRRRQTQDCTLSVAEAMRQAMAIATTPPPIPPTSASTTATTTAVAAAATIETPHDLPTPMPHLPLRRASVEKLQANAATTKLVLASSAAHGHGMRGFNPAPVPAVPHLANVTASSEHAFAGKDETRKKPFKPPLGVLAYSSIHDADASSTPIYELEASSPDLSSPGTPSSPVILDTQPTPRMLKGKSLKSSKSVGSGLKGLRNRFSSPNEAKPRELVNGEIRSSVPVVPSIPPEQTRDSVPSAVASTRSGVNSGSSALHTDSIHSSATPPSSHTSEFVHVYPDWPEMTPDAETDDEEMTVEDAIGMYADGFDTSGRPSLETEVQRSDADRQSSSGHGPSSSQQSDELSTSTRPQLGHRRSQSASLLHRVQEYEDGGLSPRGANHKHTFSKILSNVAIQKGVSTVRSSLDTGDSPRDRYGFKKASLHVSVEAYDAWNVHYAEHLERRSKKWHVMMESYGLSTDQPFRFPPKSDKIKRYVRKGIPPEFRGAAWFWYAGGPSKLAKEPGLYQEVLERVKDGQLSDNDREHIERDLNRTFPDNVRFKPDPSAMLDAQAGAGGGDNDASTTKHRGGRYSIEPETPILQSLRRVLQAFAVHNPQIGYCQSLNFIAGLLLLFLDEDEEKAFILLNIVTTIHLPGTHGVALEGANIDIAVLMSCIKDALPAIWAKLDDNGGAQLAQSIFPGAQALRLPTVSLATTAWFMSLFVGTLPIESVLRIWDCLFFEGSKTLFRIALAIFKFGERDILSVSDPMEIFQVVQTIPRGMLDINALMEVCFRRRGGFGHVSQGLIESRRQERRELVRDGVASIRNGVGSGGGGGNAGIVATATAPAEARMSIWRGKIKSKPKAVDVK